MFQFAQVRKQTRPLGRIRHYALILPLFINGWILFFTSTILNVDTVIEVTLITEYLINDAVVVIYLSNSVETPVDHSVK